MQALDDPRVAPIRQGAARKGLPDGAFCVDCRTVSELCALRSMGRRRTGDASPLELVAGAAVEDEARRRGRHAFGGGALDDRLPAPAAALDARLARDAAAPVSPVAAVSVTQMQPRLGKLAREATEKGARWWRHVVPPCRAAQPRADMSPPARICRPSRAVPLG